MTTWLASVRAAVAATLARTDLWPLALAAFLVRGGAILLLLPIVSLPGITEVASALGPIAVVFGIGQPSAAAILVVAATIGLLVAGLLLSVTVGTWLDLALLGETSEDEELDLPVHGLGASLGAAVLARLVAHAATIVALAYATLRLGYATYETVLSSGDGATIVSRVLAAVPDAPVVVLVAWLLGEAAGGIAVRRLAAGATLPRAVATAYAALPRPSVLATLLWTDGLLLVVAAPFWLAAARSWSHLRAFLFEGAPLPYLAAALLLLAATWVLGLGLLAVALTLRQVAWTTTVFPGHRQPLPEGVTAAANV